MASQIYEEKREDKSAVAAYAVRVYFPAYGDLPEKYFYWLTTEGEIDTGEPFERQLTEFPTGVHQTDRNSDRATFVVANENNARYKDFRPYENLLRKSKVVIRECLHIDGGYYESEIRFVGEISDFNLDESDKSLHFQCESDMSKTGYLVGGIILTRDRCRHEFNVNGLRPPNSGGCTWQVIQGGNPLFCSHFRKGVDGCEAHLNEHEIGLLDGYASANVQIVDSNPSGFPYETGQSCFTRNVYVLMADGSTKPINQIQIGEWVLGFDLFDNDKIVPSEVEHTFSFMNRLISTAYFYDATIEGTKEHLFYIGERIFAPLAALKEKRCSAINSEKKWLRASLLSIEVDVRHGVTYNLSTSSRNYFVTDKEGKIFYAVHNLSPFTPV